MKTNRRRLREEEDELDREEDVEDEDTEEIEKAISGQAEPETEGVTVLDETALFEKIQSIVEEVMVKSLGPIVTRQKRLEKSLTAISEQNEELAEQNEEIIKGLTTATEGAELVKGLIAKAGEQAKTDPATAENTDVTTTPEELLKKGLVGDPREAEGADPEAQAQTVSLIRKARTLLNNGNRVEGYDYEVIAQLNAGKPLSGEQVARLQKGVAAAEQSS